MQLACRWKRNPHGATGGIISPDVEEYNPLHFLRCDKQCQAVVYSHLFYVWIYFGHLIDKKYLLLSINYINCTALGFTYSIIIFF